MQCTKKDHYKLLIWTFLASNLKYQSNFLNTILSHNHHSKICNNNKAPNKIQTETDNRVNEFKEKKLSNAPKHT